LQFCRYIQPLSQLGAEITFIAPTSLVRVLNSLESFCNLTASISKQEESQFDFQLPLLSLPFLFNTRVDTIPAKIPYLAIDYQKKEIFASQICSDGRLKVGVIWNGGFRADAPVLWAVNKRRNIDLDQIAILRDIPGIDYYSLQKGDPAESELISRKDEVWPNIVNCAPLINDFSDTAALINHLDLIISVDTSSAHLAGALGKPVWILNRYDSCWRWLRGRSDSPWYPSAKLFQQKKPGDWEEVISRVKSELCNLATQHLSRPKG
jgi:Glycosyltransferase family 9 (heptosyltransferase)